jgi:transcriptional regulator with XRE-family HTH domain
VGKVMDSAIPGALGRVLSMRKLTREDVAQKARVDRKTIKRIDDGDPVKVETLAKVADALRIPRAHLTAPMDGYAHPANAEVPIPPGRRDLLLKKLTADALPGLLRTFTDQIDWIIELPIIAPKARNVLEKLEGAFEGFRVWLTGRDTCQTWSTPAAAHCVHNFLALRHSARSKDS